MHGFDRDPGLSSGIVKGLNNKAKPTIKKACGSKDEKYVIYVLDRTPGELPMHRFTYRFYG